MYFKKSYWKVLEAIWSVKSSRLLIGEIKVEPGHEDPLDRAVVMELGRGRRCSLVWTARGPGWIQIPWGESWPSTSLWVQHQFWRESG